MSVAFSNRTIGQFPISIATSLAIESSLGIHPEQPHAGVPIEGYSSLYINVRTLVRNFMGALEPGGLDGSHPVELAHFVSSEMEEIVDILKKQISRPIKVVYYFSEYKDFARKYPHAFLRSPSSNKQLALVPYLNAVFQDLLKRHTQVNADIHIEVYLDKLTVSGNPHALIITHYPYDLLSHDRFEKLTLLESHTGQLKDRSKWYTKYYQGKELFRIPFREDLLQVFGDNEIFKPFPKSNRDELIQIATERHWTSLTTKAKILENAELIKDPFFKKIFKSMLI